ncbi:MAG: alpha-L-fucosidase [Bacteroidales bacterium]|nr:alpha-L-fucosidase [Bacteroidales bacterium]
MMLRLFNNIVIAALTITFLFSIFSSCSSPEPEPFGPVPTEAQLAWQRMEINMFCHFGPNTFTGAEWGDGKEAEEVFNPAALDCRQWVEVAKQAGMGGIILTAKHHDGFCLWPSAYSTHTVADTLDVLRAFVDACRGRVRAGVYISPWDRNHPAYGTKEYNTVFANTLQEVHKTYGPFFEQWFDGACGEGPNGKRQEYDWPLFENTVFDINSNCVIFSDVGPGCRWVGNEEGRAGETCWSTLNTEGASPSENKPAPEVLTVGHQGGSHWVPAEVDVSIRSGWFWHANEHPKTVDELMEIYYNSVGRNGLLLLNVPPDTNGRISAEDSTVLVAFRAKRDRVFADDETTGGMATGKHLRGRRYKAENVLDTAYHTYWAASSVDDTLYIGTPDPAMFDIIMLQEYVPLGQRVSAFHIECWQPWLGGWVTIAEGTTIGYKRLIRVPMTQTKRLRVVFDSAMAAPIINRFALYSSTR